MQKQMQTTKPLTLDTLRKAVERVNIGPKELVYIAQDDKRVMIKNHGTDAVLAYVEKETN